MMAITNCKRYMTLLILSYLAYILKSIDFFSSSPFWLGTMTFLLCIRAE